MPAVYLSHGAPPLADDPIWPGELATWAKALPRPESILVISAHWENAPTSVSATRTVPLYYDFWGFPKHYYEVTYPAPGAPALAEAVRKLLGGQVHEHADRGLDHGAYVPLVEMYPQADVPVIQLSMPTLNPRERIARVCAIDAADSFNRWLTSIKLMIPTGTLIKKIHRQEKLSVIQPPKVGPIAGATTTAIP